MTRRSPITSLRRAGLAVLCVAAFAPLPAAAQPSGVQVTKHEVIRNLRLLCESSFDEEAREVIVAEGKTVEEVCGCTAETMWRRFPYTRYWASDGGILYERMQVEAAYPEVLRACIFE